MPPKISQWFLTYLQCPVNKNTLLEHLHSLDQVLLYIIAEEMHKDGNSHLHSYVKFVDGITAKNKLAFAFTFEGKKYHGNYQPVRSCKAVIDYCSKESNYISNFNLKTYKDKKGKTPVNVKTLRQKTVQQALKRRGHFLPSSPSIPICPPISRGTI